MYIPVIGVMGFIPAGNTIWGMLEADIVLKPDWQIQIQ